MTREAFSLWCPSGEGGTRGVCAACGAPSRLDGGGSFGALGGPLGRRCAAVCPPHRALKVGARILAGGRDNLKVSRFCRRQASGEHNMRLNIPTHVAYTEANIITK